MICLVCHEKEALTHELFGVLPCQDCQDRRRVFSLPTPSPIEMVGESIKNERNEFAASIVQPRNRYGELSKEYLDAHGTKGIKATKEEIKNARNIWDGAISPNLDITKSK